MSWSMNELPCPSFEHALDDYLTDVPEDDRNVFGYCSMCGNEIYEDEYYYGVGGEIYCEECIDDCKHTAECIRPDYEED